MKVPSRRVGNGEVVASPGWGRVVGGDGVHGRDRAFGGDGVSGRDRALGGDGLPGRGGVPDGVVRRLSGRMREERDRGAATIWVTGLMALVFFVATAIVFAGTARVARHRARSAADLSALAAARLAFADPERGCVEASSLAAGNGAELIRCSIDGYGIADVQVTVRLSLPALGDRTITADARAGPVHVADAVG